MKPYAWTQHARMKMQFYKLSEGRVKRVVRVPDRVEEGIAPGTIACMQRNTTSTKPSEIWVMVHDTKDVRKVISAWRYPGTTKKGEPLPEEILAEFRSASF